MTYHTNRYGEPILEEPLGELAKEAVWAGSADWGTGLHAAKAGLPVGEPYTELMAPFREKLWPNRLGAHEVGVSYDCATREVDVNYGPAEVVDSWKASRPDSCVTGTADFFAQLPSGEPWIDDLKTGWQAPDVVTEQTKFYLMCCNLYLYGRSRKWTTGRMSITHWSKRAFDVGEMDEPSRRWRQISLTLLDEFEMDLITAWRAATITPDKMVAGVQCAYCPSATVCPRGNS